MDSERIPRSLLRGLASELQQIDIFLAWKIPCTLVQGASISPISAWLLNNIPLCPVFYATFRFIV
jgi:hypothetical protein